MITNACCNYYSLNQAFYSALFETATPYTISPSYLSPTNPRNAEMVSDIETQST